MKKIQLDKNQILYEMVLDAPLLAKKACAGNFVLIRLNEQGERIPLTIADYDRAKGTITLVFQVVGKTTKLLANLKVDDAILDVVGPLGKCIHHSKNTHTSTQA